MGDTANEISKIVRSADNLVFEMVAQTPVLSSGFGASCAPELCVRLLKKSRTSKKERRLSKQDSRRSQMRRSAGLQIADEVMSTWNEDKFLVRLELMHGILEAHTQDPSSFVIDPWGDPWSEHGLAEIAELQNRFKERNDELAETTAEQMSELEGLREERDDLKQDHAGLKLEHSGLKQENAGLKQENAGLRQTAQSKTSELSRQLEESEQYGQEMHTENLRLRQDALQKSKEMSGVMDELQTRVEELQAENRRLRRLVKKNKESAKEAKSPASPLSPISPKTPSVEDVQNGAMHPAHLGQIERLLSMSEQHREIVQRLFPSDLRGMTDADITVPLCL